MAIRSAKNATGVVVMVAITEKQELLLVEQYRPPVHARVLELPAGIVGDVDAHETNTDAAARELLEETGYTAGRITPLFTGSVSPGLVGEVLSFFLMQDLTRIHQGGGVEDENIIVHHAPLLQAESYFQKFEENGGIVDCKTRLGWLLGKEFLNRSKE